MPIIWEKPDGSLAVTQIKDAYLAAHRRPEETTEEAVLRLAEEARAEQYDLVEGKIPPIDGARAVLVKTVNMPSSKAQRHQWRLHGDKVVIDSSVPTPPDPVQVVTDEIDQANTIGDIKRALKRVLGLR